MTTVIINTDTPAGKMLLEHIKQHPSIARVIEEQTYEEKKRYSYQEFKEKLASSLNERFNAGI